VLVRNRMSNPPITISKDAAFQQGLSLMQQRRLRRLPVTDASGTLIGIVAERDLLLAATRHPASSVDIAEFMKTKLVTATPDMDITQAAKLMLDHKVGALPVVEDGKLVGMITESDIFRRFVELRGQA
jgi:acetoin utilization protein AcuB